MPSSEFLPDALMTRKGAYGALVGDMVFLPNGRGMSADSAEECGWEESDEEDTALLTPECLTAAQQAQRTLSDAQDARDRYDAQKAQQAAERKERAKERRERQLRADMQLMNELAPIIIRLARRLSGE